jgi:alpha-amylase/alpha-mannosidase (GH57 family)
MTIPIKVALLWHQHQPYYKSGSVYQLPWVYLHATKDYLEMAEHLRANPKMHAMINLVPSLIEQLEDYISGANDRLIDLIRKPVEELSPDERVVITKYCFHANRTQIIAKSKRYTELLHLEHWTYDQDFLDLEVLFLLAWTGQLSKDIEPLVLLVAQDRNFTEEQKQIVFQEHNKILRSIIETHTSLTTQGGVELSTSPYYHPILPLLCDTNSAREAVADIALPSSTFSYPDDARVQIERAVKSHSDHFGNTPQGMWPSEGSISEMALAEMAQSGIKWTASDEAVLHHSIAQASGNKYEELEKYFPRKFIADDKSITVFFRDHQLSDKIGFDYQHWKPEDAVNDFLHYVRYVRSQILGRFGEEALHNACISVILDGENCWESYPKNGSEFLTTLYSKLSEDEEIHPVTFSEALREIGEMHIRPIEHIVAGSWINGNFKIWIGHSEKNRAWDLLTHTRGALESFKKEHPNEQERYSAAFDAIMKAEGSDWFWWYGDDHISADRPIFDELFRGYLLQVYHLLGMVPPAELAQAIVSSQSAAIFGAMHRSEE